MARTSRRGSRGGGDGEGVEDREAATAAAMASLREENERLTQRLADMAAGQHSDELAADDALKFTWRPTQVPHDPDNPRPRHAQAQAVIGCYSLRQADPESAELVRLAQRDGKPGRAEKVMLLCQLVSYLHDAVAFAATPSPDATADELGQDIVAMHDHLVGVLEMTQLRLEEVEVRIRTPQDAVLLAAYGQRYKLERRTRMSVRGRAIHDYVAARRRSADIAALAKASAGGSSPTSSADPVSYLE